MRPQAAKSRRVKEARQAFRSQQADLPLEKLVFIDETAAWCSMAPYYGWSPSGEQAVITGSRHGKRLSVVGAISQDGSRGHMVYEGTLNGDRMVEYIDGFLGPNLRRGDILVMDGLRVHKTAKVREAAARFGAEILILPPYSPELNPIEHTWSTLKSRIRKFGADCLDELHDLIDTVWDDIAGFSHAWIRHCGYGTST